MQTAPTTKTSLTVVISREDAFHLCAELVGADKQGTRNGHGKNASEALGNLVRINPERFGIKSYDICVEQIGQTKYQRAYLRTDLTVRSDSKIGHKTNDAAIGSMVKNWKDKFGISEIKHDGL